MVKKTDHVDLFLRDEPRPLSPDAVLRVCTSLVWDQKYEEADALIELLLEYFQRNHAARWGRRFGELLGMRSMLAAFVNSAKHRRCERALRRPLSKPRQRKGELGAALGRTVAK